MISTPDMIGRLLLAAALGSIIGWERERRAWSAGLRTHMMVCLGASLMMITSAFGFSDVVGAKGIELDPSRIAAQVVSGIGFLGAGTILFLRNEVVKGLTTAAGLWTVAGIGLAVGGGLYLPALVTTAIAMIILIVFKPVEEKYFAKNRFKSIKILLKLNEVRLEEIEHLLKSFNVSFNEINLVSTLEEGINEMKIRIQKKPSKNEDVFVLMEELKKLKGVREVNFLA
jgi:putative Mg2+ transporter-C (MgtC) family protein